MAAIGIKEDDRNNPWGGGDITKYNQMTFFTHFIIQCSSIHAFF